MYLPNSLETILRLIIGWKRETVNFWTNDMPESEVRTRTIIQTDAEIALLIHISASLQGLSYAYI